MRRLLTGLFGIVFVLCALGDDADAKRRRRRAAAADSGPPGRFGLGLILGGPTGLSGKLFLSDSVAFDFAVGYYYGLGYDDGVGAHADVLWHPLVIAYTEPFALPLYVGVGGRIVDDHCRGRRCDDGDGIDVGVRVPIGIAMEFNAVPLDVFLELALVVDIIDDDDHRVHLDGAVGVRYWF